MKISSNTRKAIFDLVKLILVNKSRGVGQPEWPFRFGTIPDDVKCVGINGDSIMMSAEDYVQYRNCLRFLSEEKSLEHISFSELDKELWHFYCEIYCDPAAFGNDSGIRVAVNALLDRLNKPLIEYEVLISLDKHLQLSRHAIELAGVKFFQITEEDMAGWGIAKNVSSLHKHFYEAVIGNAVAFMYEQCYGSDKAIESAKIKLNTALNILRISLLMDHDPRIVSWRIHDQELLFRAGEEIAIREKGNSTSASLNFHSGFRSWTFTIDDVYLNQIVESKRVIDSLFLPAHAQSNIYKRIRRALEWIGGSVTRERLDDKIVDICTALETLLATKQDGRKGEAIALRMMLLYSHLKKPFFDPFKLLDIYEKRSDIVHGSERDICLESDYKLSQWIALDVLANILTYINEHKITQHAEFFSDLESDFALIEKSVDFWKSHPNYKGIVEAASEMIKRRFLRGTS